ncbi:MAG TPA: energy-coupling factor transporter ATPase [Eubacteriaceae bacterium]|jgi:energy-coupling factor transport system ATP-binding protein|nr:energy-coupling factor transporter ATPase [Eubacteriaceae bacterium]
MDKMIKIENLTHEYKGNEGDITRALNRVSLDISRGEFVVIIGHNGSGKSTLAKHLNAILLPTEGLVEVNGLDTANPENLWQIRQSAGMVFQNPDNQIVATIVEEDVAFGPENLGIPSQEIRERVKEALRIVGMEEYANHAPHLLSGGQKQRIAIAGIIAMRPQCIILDEPTAMLDPSGRREVMETITRLNKDEGITIVHITHFMDEAVNADRIIVMEDGEIVLEGQPREIFSKVDKLKEIGLDVPHVTEIAFQLKENGVSIESNILTVDEMVRELCP